MKWRCYHQAKGRARKKNLEFLTGFYDELADEEKYVAL